MHNRLLIKPSNNSEELIMWTKPAYTDLRIGFEVTMYFANR
jgi:pyrroloquinoline quinone biosynthesis protein A